MGMSQCLSLRENDLIVESSVIVMGGGGHAKVVISTLHAAGYRVSGVFDDDVEKIGQKILGVEILGTLNDVPDTSKAAGVIAVGDNHTRARIVSRFPSIQWVSVVHPQAYVAETAEIGCGTVVFAGAIIQPGSVIGEYVIINTGATVDHDCVIEDFVHIAPGCHLAGGVHLGTGAFLGIGSAVIPYKKVGTWAIVGAGGVVTKDLPDGVCATGIPARIK